MAHNGVVAGGGRLTDQISIGVLAASVARDAVDDAVAVTGRQARRSDGKLPPHVMVYFAMAMALFADDASGSSAARAPARRPFPPDHRERILAAIMADITSPRHLSPARRSRSHPRMIKRARHNSYRVKRPGDTGIRQPGPAAVLLANPVTTVTAA